MNTTQTRTSFQSHVALRALWVLFIAMTAATAMRDAAGGARVLQTEWILVQTVYLAVAFGFLAKRGLIDHALVAATVVVPCMALVAPELQHTASGVVSSLAIGVLLGGSAAAFRSLGIEVQQRFPGPGRYGRRVLQFAALALFPAFPGRDWFVEHEIEGPAIVMRPLAEALASGRAALPILGLFTLAAVLIAAHQLVRTAARTA
jgi:hypothetical protein